MESSVKMKDISLWTNRSSAGSLRVEYKNYQLYTQKLDKCRIVVRTNLIVAVPFEEVAGALRQYVGGDQRRRQMRYPQWNVTMVDQLTVIPSLIRYRYRNNTGNGA